MDASQSSNKHSVVVDPQKGMPVTTILPPLEETVQTLTFQGRCSLSEGSCKVATSIYIIFLRLAGLGTACIYSNPTSRLPATTAIAHQDAIFVGKAGLNDCRGRFAVEIGDRDDAPKDAQLASTACQCG